MNKETVKKYKKEFDHWLNGGELEYQEDKAVPGHTWYSAQTPSFDGGVVYRIKPFVPKQGDTILVADNVTRQYKERVFVCMDGDNFRCISYNGGWIITGGDFISTHIWPFAKPVKK